MVSRSENQLLAFCEKTMGNTENLDILKIGSVILQIYAILKLSKCRKKAIFPQFFRFQFLKMETRDGRRL